MNLSPTDRAEVLSLVADRIVVQIREDAGGDLSELVVLPIAAAASLVGLSAQQTTRRLPVTKTAVGRHGVTVANIRRHIEQNAAPKERP